MTNQIRGFALRFTSNVNVYQLLTLGLALGLAILGMPGGGGSGA
jgi:hypothetical protein